MEMQALYLRLVAASPEKRFVRISVYVSGSDDMKQLILGGARSGKSALAETLALESTLEVVTIVTAEAADEEMAARIQHHQQQRPPHWRVVEEPLLLATALAREASPQRCLLVDCLTLWLSNLLCCDDPQFLDRQISSLIDGLVPLPGRIILVSNEVGLGIVPMNPQARRFRDLAGRLHQDLAAHCEQVVFTVAGLPLVMKGPPLAPGPASFRK